MERSGRLMMGAVCGAALLALSSGLAPAVSETNAPASVAPAAFRFGADERIREEYFDFIPINAKDAFSRGGENDYIRFRTRVWGTADLTKDITFRARLVNEFRLWDEPSMSGKLQKSNYFFPDESVFDALNVEIRGLADKTLDLKIGRQDLVYGNGKVLLEGTPKDGSRSVYFNAVKATWKGIPDTTIDFLGIYDPTKDPLAINDANRDLVGLSGNNDNFLEAGAGFYAKNSSCKTVPFEAYGLYKREGDYDTPAAKNTAPAGGFVAPKFAWQTLDSAAGQIENPALDLGTLGFRVMPTFCKILSGNLEAAYQFGKRANEDVNGSMVDGYLTCQLPVACPAKPAIDAGVYYLSGDDSKTGKDEGWNPLWARYPQFSELYVYAFDADGAGRWSNLMMPHVNLSATPTKWMPKLTAMVGYMKAPEKTGPGTGDERGWLETIRTDFNLGGKLLCASDTLTGHLLLELLEPGDYYTDAQRDHTAFFARWEMVYAF